MAYYNFGNIKNIFAEITPDHGLFIEDAESASAVSVLTRPVEYFARHDYSGKSYDGGTWVSVPVPPDTEGSVVDYVPAFIDKLTVVGIIAPVVTVSMDVLEDDARLYVEAMEQDSDDNDVTVSSRIAYLSAGLCVRTSKTMPPDNEELTVANLIPLINVESGASICIRAEWDGPSFMLCMEPNADGAMSLTPIVNGEVVTDIDNTEKYESLLQCKVIGIRDELPDLEYLCSENEGSDRVQVPFGVHIRADASPLCGALGLELSRDFSGKKEDS